MRKAGIREARQNLSVLIDEVRRGREVILTERGVPVARLAPIAKTARDGFPDLAGFRSTLPTLDPPASASIERERDEW